MEKTAEGMSTDESNRLRGIYSPEKDCFKQTYIHFANAKKHSKNVVEQTFLLRTGQIFEIDKCGYLGILCTRCTRQCMADSQ